MNDLTNDMEQTGESVHRILASRHLTDREFHKISAMMYDLCRLNLHEGKKALVQARLNKRLRMLGIDSYTEYLAYVKDEPTGRELVTLVNTLTTNLTYFFREKDHFDYLEKEVLAKLDARNASRLRIWSAGCSSGEEAYTMGMVLRETVPDVDRMNALILGTDISTGMLARARQGCYSLERFRDTPSALRDKYFLRQLDRQEKIYQAKPELTRLIRFRYLNLMEPWPMHSGFDVIFCRNVMIYFDKETQRDLIRRFYDALNPGGVFMVGHSESLTGVHHDFRYVRPTIYIKP